MLSTKQAESSPLFRGISHEEYLAMYDCFHAVSRSFSPGEVIYDFSVSGDQVGILEKGSASLVRIDEEGVETVLENLDPGGVFGRTLAFSTRNSDVLEVVCRSQCSVLFFDYAHVLKRCSNACTCHSLLVENMLRLMEEKAQVLSERIDVLSRRSIREKLLCCFSQFREKTGRDSFLLPFSLGVLADYIAADRSAMMRELKKMKEEGLLELQNREVTLHISGN